MELNRNWRFVMTITLLGAASVRGQVDRSDKTPVGPYFATVKFVYMGPGHVNVPKIAVFESEIDHKNWVGAFHNGVGEDIPFGIYRVLAGSEPGRVPRYVWVYQSEVTVLVGIPYMTGDMVYPYTFEVPGQVSGSLPTGKENIAKLVGVYLSQSQEVTINSQGQFLFEVPVSATYMLLIINEDGILATRVIDVPLRFRDRPLEIKIGDGVEGPHGKLGQPDVTR